MEIKSLKFNFFMGIIRMATGMLFPIIIMPYINRVLNANLVGKVEYANVIVNYFIMFTALGIPVYGIREIARNRDNKLERSKIFFELSLILLIANIIGYAIYFYLLHSYSVINQDINIFYILGLNIFFTSFAFEWFYQGIEDQKHITVRSVLMRLISIVLIFLFIKNPSDYIKYCIIQVFNIVGGTIFNILILKNYIVFSKEIFGGLNIKRHIKFIFVTFAAGLAVTMYTQIDLLMIGNISGMTYVGLYNMPMKFIRLSTSLITILGATILPRLTKLYSNENIEQYKDYLNQGFSLLLMYSFLVILGLYLLSENIISIFGGENFLEAILTMKILSFITIFSGVAYFKGIVILYSQKKDKLFLYAVLISALINFILNYKLIPIFNQNGAAIATLISEISVIIFIKIFAKKEMDVVKIFTKNNFKYLVTFILNLGFFSSLKFELSNEYIKFIVQGIFIVLVYFTTLILLRERYIIERFKILQDKYRNK